jgi:hypothetical protein
MRRQPLVHQVYDAQSLMRDFPPRLKHQNKQVVYDIACPADCMHAGQLTFTRWRKFELPSTFRRGHPTVKIISRPDCFGYEPSAADAIEWYLNFAHYDLFAFYGGRLFAQDEMQVAEHPALASLREALLAAGITPATVDSGQPTPCLIQGVERRCRIHFEPNAMAGRPQGLYGNRFSEASPQAVAAATEPIVPPTITNILAMEAPDSGHGCYSLAEIEYILNTAVTGFAAVRLASPQSVGSRHVTVHSGWWGCGAYGGNRTLMAMLQVLAAQIAWLDQLVFHAGNADGVAEFERAQALLAEQRRRTGSDDLSELLKGIESLGLEWGQSDGN